jgi:hypothetical protein
MLTVSQLSPSRHDDAATWGTGEEKLLQPLTPLSIAGKTDNVCLTSAPSLDCTCALPEGATTPDADPEAGGHGDDERRWRRRRPCSELPGTEE